jgi:ornithine cyclodeaminase
MRAPTYAKTKTGTRFLSPECVAAMIGRRGVAACLGDMAAYIHADLLRWEEFAKWPRIASHSRHGVIELMPVADGRTFAFKYVNGHPKNARFGLPTVLAFGVLADVATGAPLLVSELTLTTALRTAATSAVAARALARPGSRTMALIGNGAQSEFQALAFSRLLGIDRFHLFDVDPAATAKLAANLAQAGFDSKRCASTRDAVRGADIVTTITADKTNATILTSDMIEPGMHINAVGGDCPGKTELGPDLLANARVFVEYEPQTRIEGDIQRLPADFEVTELWRVLAGLAPGRHDASEVTVFDSVGFALEDYSALRYLADLADGQGATETISLVPELADPRNLYALIGAHAARAAITDAACFAA